MDEMTTMPNPAMRLDASVSQRRPASFAATGSLGHRAPIVDRVPAVHDAPCRNWYADTVVAVAPIATIAGTDHKSRHRRPKELPS